MAVGSPIQSNGHHRGPVSLSQSLYSEADGRNSLHSSRRVSARFHKNTNMSSTSSTQMAETVTLLKRRCAEQLGAAMASDITSSYGRLIDWISNERLRHLPTEGSPWDKVLAWAQSFAEKFNDFDLAVEQFTGGNYDGAEIAFGYCILLLELGEENAPALQTSFGFFFQRSLDLIALLDRVELFNASSQITEQLIVAYADLVTLVSDVALRFYQVIRSANDSEVFIDIYSEFASSIGSFQSRRERIVESMWSHQLVQEGVDTSRVANIKTLRSWLGVDDHVLKYKTGDHTHFVNDRQALTCLWLAPYLTRFLNSNRDSLTITGGLGSGKTVLAGTIVDTLQKTASRRSYNIVFVPVDARIKAYANGLHVAHSILFQLLEQRVGNVALYKTIAEAFEVSQTTRDLASYEQLLWTTIEKTIEVTMSNAKDTILVVDGIDEVSEDPAVGQHLLKRLRDVSAKHEKVRLITLSQQTALPTNIKPDVDITPDLIYDDVFAVVSSLLARSPHFTSTPQMQQNILVDQIVNASKGSFLWAKLVTKSLVMENSPDKLNKSVENIKKSPKPVQDIVRELLTTSNISDEGKLLVYWLTFSERPMTVDELSILYATDPRRGTTTETTIDVLRTLKPVASLVFLQDGLLYLRHTIIRQTLISWFEQNKPTREPALDFIYRLLTYLKSTVRDSKDPSFTSLDLNQVDQRFHQNPMMEYAVRYWPKHFLDLPAKSREASPDLKNVLPTSPSIALIEQTTWTWLPTPIKLSWHTTLIDLRRKVFNDHTIVLQSVIDLARILQTITDYQTSANYYYLGVHLASNIFSKTHPLTVQCVNKYLEVTNTIKLTTRTEVVNHREELLVMLINTYKQQYGTTSEQVIGLQRLLIELYRSLKEEQKAVTVEREVRGVDIEDTTTVGTRAHTGSKGVTVKAGRTKDFDYQSWDFDEVAERDVVVKTDAWKRIDELLQLAMSHASKNETIKAEQCYVEAWYHMSVHARSVSTIETHLKKISLAIAFATFYKSVKREVEAGALLQGVWEEYQSLSVARTEQVNSKFVEVARLMKSIGLTTVALNIFRHCSSVYRSLNKVESSSYREVQEQERATYQEVLKQASSSSASASHFSDSAVTEIFTYLEQDKSTKFDATSTDAVKQIVSSYLAQHRYKESTHILKRTLKIVWSSIFSQSIEDVTVSNDNSEFAIELVDQLIFCYRARHRIDKAVQFRERLYHALKLSRKVDDQLVQRNITELFSIYEQIRATEKIIQLHRELLEDYKKVYGPNHQRVVNTLFTLAKLTSPEPVSMEYYRQIVTILSKDSDFCHPDALEPLRMVAGHYWNERRYPGAVWAYSLLFRTFIHKGKEINAFQEHTFVSTVYNRYVASLRATTTDIRTVYDITTQYRKTCIDIFGANHQVTVEATLYLARVCESSKRYQAEAIALYEQLLKESKASQYHAEIRQTLEAIYEEQSLEAARSTSVNASSEQVSRAISVVRQRLTKNRSEYGWAHHESLEQLKEMSYLYARQSKKEEAYKELHEATRQVIANENSSVSLTKAATTVAESYIAMSETHKGLEVVEELRWQLITKDSSNSKKYGIDITSSGRSAAIYLAQLEYALRQDTSTSFNEIYLSILTEIVYYEELQRSIRSNLSIEQVFFVASRLYTFLGVHQRLIMRNHVENELITFFLRSSGEKAKVGDVAQVKVLVITMLQYIETHEIKNWLHSVSLASIEYVRYYVQQGQQKQACDLAQTAFRYIHAVGGYRTASAIKHGLVLALTIAHVEDNKDGLRQARFSIAGDIVRLIFRSAETLKMNLASIPLHQINVFVTIFGEQKDYVTLEWFLSILWQARESHHAWKPASVLELGYRLVLARFLLGIHEQALQLATDIAYNLRRVYGATHLATLEVNVLLSQLCVSTGLAFQSQQGAEDIARRYYKRAITVHENVLRSLTLDPLGLGDEDDVTVLSSEPEPMDLSVVVDKDASQGSYARKHLHLLKLALERFGGYPKGYAEYEAINADVFRAYPDELRGVEGLEKWNVEKFGKGKSQSEDGALNTNVRSWSISSSSTSNGVDNSKKVANGHANGNGVVHGHTANGEISVVY